MSRRGVWYALLCLLVALGLASSGSAGPGKPMAPPQGKGRLIAHERAPYYEGELLVGFKPGVHVADRASAKAFVNATTLRTFRSGAEHWRLAPGQDVDTAIRFLLQDPGVRFAEPNYVLTADVIPNDLRFDELWGMRNTGQTGGTDDADIDADAAWGVSTGSPNVVVAVIDTGIDYNHPDLAANIWTNPGEIAGNGIDDDANGFVDDVHGWDFYNDDGDPFDDNSHGTHVSGTIGAIGNNGIGVAGVNWNVKLMAVKFLSAGGSGSTADAVASVDYAVMMGADLTSNSWGGGSFSQALYDAINASGAAEMAFVAAAGNGSTNTDNSPHYPSAYNLNNIISVAATDHNDNLASFSNWGPTTVDLAAPGVNTLSTVPGNSYGVKSGTSMATPHVAGVAALIRAVSPGIPVAQLKTVLLNSTDPVPALAGLTVTGGRLNAFFPIADPDDTAPDPVLDLAVSEATSNGLIVSWTATGDDDGVGTASSYDLRYSSSPISDDAAFAAATPVGNEPTPSPAGTPEAMEVAGLDPNSTYHFALKVFDEWGNDSGLSNGATGTTLPPPTGDVTPTFVSDALFTGETSTQQVTLSNIGVGTLDFTIPRPLVGQPAAEGSGGPDNWGYRWIDSDDPGGPIFDWVDISGIGTRILFSSEYCIDCNSGPIPMGMTFPFYGNVFDEFRMVTNGWISFTSSATTYTNSTLPSSSAPENMIAPFWDDLVLRSGTGSEPVPSRAYYHNDGTRLIIQYDNFYRIGDYDADLTFQVILYPSGQILYQYLTMANALLDSATVGIQNEAKDDGLTVVYNDTYVHDGLAVSLSALPQWLTASPTSGRLTAGQSKLINLNLDAAGLEGGVYPGMVNILTNDPAHPVLTVDVSLDVTGAPDATVRPTSLEFGDRFLGLPDSLNLRVLNVGTDVLHVTGITTSDPQLAVAPTTFDLPPKGFQDVTVTWTPPVLGPFGGTVTVLSDDAGEPAIDVPVTGNAIPAPVMITNPSSFSDTLFSGESAIHNLEVRNTGGSDLIVETAADQGNGGNGLVIGSGLGTDGSGGPDTFGYRWRDSDEAGGPVFDWVEISDIGTWVQWDSDNYCGACNVGPFPLGFDFPFYGNTFTEVRASVTGFLSFTSSLTTGANSLLPNSSTTKPENLLAVFWDILYSRNGSGSEPVPSGAYYYSDGSRFIFQWDNFYRSGDYDADLDFQVILYPTGKIVYQYKTMANALLDSATIGFQNATRDDGLTVVYNDDYVHDGLAVEISYIPDWLTVTPTSAVIPPGGSANFDVKFDATGRFGGLLTGNVVLNTNIPTQPQELLPASLTVIGSPEVVIYPPSHDYGTVYTGYPHVTSMQVVNIGTEDLLVSDIDSTDPEVFVELPPGATGIPEEEFLLHPGESREFSVRWSPTDPYTMNAEVRVHSNDPVNPIYAMPLSGVAIDPPIAAWSPGSFFENLNVGDVVHRTLHLENNGASDLEYSAVFRLAGGTAVEVYDELVIEDDVDHEIEGIDPRPGILGTGGPDQYGYTWKDSTEPGGPVFDWVEISDIGTWVQWDADNYCGACNVGPFPIGFDFPYYGETFDQVRASVTGFLSFTSTSTSSSNQPLPNSGSSVPENLLAVFWDALYSRNGSGAEPVPSGAYYYSDGNRFIFQYDTFYRTGDTDADLDFQVILYRSGRIVYQYKTMANALLDSATIGLQNGAKDDGLTVVYNDDYVTDGLRIDIRHPFDFLDIDPRFGVVPAGQSVDLDLTFDVSELIGGLYTASLDMTTNDPAHALIAVPITLDVTGIPDIEAVPAALDFPTIFIHFTTELPMTVRNVGTDVLTITGYSTDGQFSVTGLDTPVSLAVGEEIPLTVTFAPTIDGAHAGSLTLLSDDPDEGALVVPLTGTALIPPVIDADPAAIDTALPPGGSRVKTLTVINNGGSDLNWSTGIVGITGQEGALGAGGPDAYGYKWKDSDEPGGPVFTWTDIKTIGTPIVFDPDGYCTSCTAGPFPIGFSFPFYEGNFNEVYVSTSGWLSFTFGGRSPTNRALPSSVSSSPENMVAAFWDYLVLRNGTGSEPVPSGAYYYFDGTRFIVQWDNFYTLADYDTNFTFQAILYPNGKIVYQYLTMANAPVNSGTVGWQNATKDDGQTIVYNDDYVHDALAVEIAAAPDWILLDPPTGTVPAGGSQDVSVLLSALGLEDGTYEAEIHLTSNDPYNPDHVVPVSLNVSLVTPAYVDFEPDVLNLGSSGNTVKMIVELPPDLDPYDVDPCSVLLNDSVPVLGCPDRPMPGIVEYGDDWPEGGNGIAEVSFKFDRDAVASVVGDESPATVSIQGEVTDVQWWRGTATVTTLTPKVLTPGPGEFYVAGMVVPVTWEAPAFGGTMRYSVQLSLDGGATWTPLATGLAGTSFDWTADSSVSSSSRVRVLAYDDSAMLLGYDDSDGYFVLAGNTMPPPRPIVPESLRLERADGLTYLVWEWPEVDETHGPAAGFRVLVTDQRGGDLQEVALVTDTVYEDASGDPAPGGIVFYRIVSTNSAGDGQ